MKTIILLRHAKSDWQANYDSDHERPLNKRGRSAAPLMGRFLSEADQVPDRIFCSSATRAAETLALAAEAGGWSCPREVVPELYATDCASSLQFIHRCADTLNSILLVGHEPTWSELAGALTGGGQLRMPTAAMARVDCIADRWREIRFGDGTLVWHVTPKLLRHQGEGS